MAPLLIAQIKKRMKDWDKKDFPKDWRKTLKKYKKSLKTKNKLIIFTGITDIQPEIMNGYNFFRFIITINAEWVARIVLDETKDTLNAFKITVGHEATHQTKQLPRIAWCIGIWTKYICRHGFNNSLTHTKKYFQVMSHINEVHSDFGAALLEAEANRNKLIQSIKYKDKLHPNSKDDAFHPSWKTREFYVRHFNFNDDLISKIIKINDFHDVDFEKKIYKRFKDREINLVPEPIKQDDIN